MNYIVSIENPENHFIQFKGEVDSVNKNYLLFQLPVWRPGRYAKQNYVENLYGLKFLDDLGRELTYEKLNSNQWKVNSANAKKVIFSYQYFSNIFDGGSCFLNEYEVYINPVNCFFYILGEENNSINVEFLFPQEYKVATGLKKNGKGKYFAKNFDELADCPIMASEQLANFNYDVEEVTFNIWLSGEHRINIDELTNQFKVFTEEQIRIFKEFPVEEYHFLIKILPDRAYHGVEHCNSTVVVIGPSYSLLEDGFFKEHFLGVCSHELFHTWNVKSIRPKDWFPYNFSKESFSKLGYIAEGITTYYGDLLLLRSEIILRDEYFSIFSKDLNNYFQNFGRENLSLAESSFDTWVDGYVRNFPSRKVSIYNEGCLVTFMLDVDIIEKTEGQRSFDDVMEALYFNYGKLGKGLEELDYKRVVEEIADLDYTNFFEDYIWGRKSYQEDLIDGFNKIGVELKEEFSPLLSQTKFGLKMYPGFQNKILDVHPMSPLKKLGVVGGDEILSINQKVINNNLEEWLKFYEGEESLWAIKRNGCIFEGRLRENKTKLFKDYRLVAIEKPSNKQRDLFNFWAKRGRV